MVKNHGVLPSAGQPPSIDQRGGRRTLQPGETRYPSGRRRRQQSHQFTNMTLWQRLRGVAAMQDVGHVVGRLYFTGELTEQQAAAALRYAEIVGRFHRYHGQGLRLTAASPAYERGFAHDNEIERHHNGGTIDKYERRARNAKKAYDRLQKHIPNATARAVMDDLCLHEVEISVLVRRDAATLLNRIAHEFGLVEDQER